MKNIAGRSLTAGLLSFACGCGGGPRFPSNVAFLSDLGSRVTEKEIMVNERKFVIGSYIPEDVRAKYGWKNLYGGQYLEEATGAVFGLGEYDRLIEINLPVGVVTGEDVLPSDSLGYYVSDDSLQVQGWRKIKVGVESSKYFNPKSGEVIKRGNRYGRLLNYNKPNGVHRKD